MTDFRSVHGFEEIWRASSRAVYGEARRPQQGRSHFQASLLRAHLRRLLQRAPEVVMTVTGASHSPARLAAHLRYISRKSALALEDQDGCQVKGSAELSELVADWCNEAALSPTCRRDSPLSHHFVLSMPRGADPTLVKEAARDCASQMAAGRFDYLLVLHTDTANPHVHLVVSALGREGARFYFWTPELKLWRETFARALCERGCEAAATPRYVRGVAQKPERSALRFLRDKFERGVRPIGRVERRRLVEAATTIVSGGPTESVWDRALAHQRAEFRALGLAQIEIMERSSSAEDRALARAFAAYLEALPEPQTRHQRLVKTLSETLRAPIPAPLHTQERERTLR